MYVTLTFTATETERERVKWTERKIKNHDGNGNEKATEQKLYD